MIGSDLFFTSKSEQLAALSVRHAVPSIYQFREFAAKGGLLSYGGSSTDWGYQGGIHTGRILLVPSRRTCRFNRRPSSSFSSTSTPPGPSASRSRLPSSPVPTR